MGFHYYHVDAMALESNNNSETCLSYYRVQKRANVPSVRDFIIYFEIYFETTITSFHTYFNMFKNIWVHFVSFGLWNPSWTDRDSGGFLVAGYFDGIDKKYTHFNYTIKWSTPNGQPPPGILF